LGIDEGIDAIQEPFGSEGQGLIKCRVNVRMSSLT